MISSIPSLPISSPKETLKPFLKWPGGKRWVARDLAPVITTHLRGKYYEPFLGGGAVYFALRPKIAALSDINEDLINVYRQVKKQPIKLIDYLKKMTVSSEEYYRIREEKPENELSRAVRFLYLNRTAFGGMYRVNSEGQFNVPYGGGDRTPELLWEDKLIEKASEALQSADLFAVDFEEMIDLAGEGDIIYCDPTYTVAHDNNGFVRYNERNFSWVDQKRLADAVLRASKRKAIVFVNNACHQSLLDFYSPFVPINLSRISCVSRKTEARREVKESLFIISTEDNAELALEVKKIFHKD